jgi:Family of unknown function (DUF6353)
MGPLSKRLAGTTELYLRRHGPAILTSAGIAGFAATTYLTGKAVLESRGRVLDFREKKAKIMARQLDETYTRKEQGRELGELFVRDGLEIIKVFSPAITTGSVAVLCIIASHGMLRRQQTALAAAYTALDTGFRAYRKRVEAEVGPERELELYRGVRMVEREEGADPDLPCEIDFADKLPSPYAKFFDELNPNWTKTPEYNLLFLRSQQNWANDRLRAYGFIYLNEVYESLGIPRSQAGQIVGWRLEGDGDGFVDFGIYDIYDESSRAFVNGVEGSILLDFNVDGPITIS